MMEGEKFTKAKKNDGVFNLKNLLNLSVNDNFTQDTTYRCLAI